MTKEIPKHLCQVCASSFQWHSMHPSDHVFQSAVPVLVIPQDTEADTSAPASSGEIRTTSTTGAEKGVKPERHDLIPVPALQLLATLYGRGAEKYAAHNWRKGYEWSKSYAAAQRHMQLFWDGEDIDPEMGLPHVTCAAFHMFTLMVFMQEQPDFDDRFKRPQPDPLAGWDQELIDRNMAAVQEQIDNPIRVVNSKELMNDLFPDAAKLPGHDLPPPSTQAIIDNLTGRGPRSTTPSYPHGGEEVSHSGD